MRNLFVVLLISGQFLCSPVSYASDSGEQFHFPLYTPNVPDHLDFSIKASKVRKFIKHFLTVSNTKSGLITEKQKKPTFPAEILLPDSTTPLDAKFRLTGDYTDHVEGYLPSLSINLKGGNIGHITRFRLLIPETKNGEDEILLSLIFEALGFPTLYTRNVQVKNERSIQSMIFQEKVAKEFLERWRFRETPVLEADERNIWIRRKIQTRTQVGRRNLPGPWSLTIDNDEFIKNPVAKNILLDALTLGSIASFNGFKLDRIQRLHLFEDVHRVFSAEHGLVAHNRKFIYDPIYRGLVPIYYDGNPKLRDALKLKQIFDSTKSKLLSIDIEKMFLEYQKRGGVKEFGFLQKIFRHIATLKEIPCCDPPKKENLVYSFHGVSAHDYFPDTLIHIDGKALLCKSRVKLDPAMIPEKCDKIDESKELKLLTRKNLKGSPRKNVYEPMSFGRVKIRDQSLQFNFPMEDERAFQLRCSHLNESNQMTVHANQVLFAQLSDLANCSLDEPLRLTINHETSSIGRVVLIGNAPAGLKLRIRFSGNSAPDNTVRYDRNLLTGCVTFLDTTLTDLKIDIDGAPCEDAVNFLRTTGKVAKLSVKNSAYDAIDADFGNMEFDEINVINAGNDCIDFSAGNYTVARSHLEECGDKAISIGEKATFSALDVHVKNSPYGLVSKDSSIARVKRLKAENVGVCLSAYRKKMEFAGAEIDAGWIKGCRTDIENDGSSRITYEEG